MARDERHPAEGDALPGHGCRDQLVVRREVEHARRAQLGQPHRLQPQVPVVQRMASVRLHPQQGVAGQVGGADERRVAGAAQARAADRKDRLAEQACAEPGRRRDRLVADGDVDRAPLQVGQRISCRDAHVDAGMQGDEGRQARDEPEAGEAGRRRHHDGLHVLRAHELARGPVEPAQRLGDGAVERPAVFRQFESPVQAPEERHAEPVFERLDLPAHGRLGECDLLCGPGEAQVPRGRLERDEQLQRRQLEGPAHGGVVSHARGAFDSFAITV